MNRCRKTVLKATQTDVVDLSLLDGMYMTETFYDLLNVSPQADEKAIRRAYLVRMRGRYCHGGRQQQGSQRPWGARVDFRTWQRQS